MLVPAQQPHAKARCARKRRPSIPSGCTLVAVGRNLAHGKRDVARTHANETVAVQLPPEFPSTRLVRITTGSRTSAATGAGVPEWAWILVGRGPRRCEELELGGGRVGCGTTSLPTLVPARNSVVRITTSWASGPNAASDEINQTLGQRARGQSFIRRVSRSCRARVPSASIPPGASTPTRQGSYARRTDFAPETKSLDVVALELAIQRASSDLQQSRAANRSPPVSSRRAGGSFFSRDSGLTFSSGRVSHSSYADSARRSGKPTRMAKPTLRPLLRGSTRGSG